MRTSRSSDFWLRRYWCELGIHDSLRSALKSYLFIKILEQSKLLSIHELFPINQLALPTDARFGHIECRSVCLWCERIVVFRAQLSVWVNLFPCNWFYWSDIQCMLCRLRTFPATASERREKWRVKIMVTIRIRYFSYRKYIPVLLWSFCTPHA